jgi:phosphoglucosamine mutase
MRAQGGVMISASHNPYQDNGMKVFGSDGFKLDDALEAQLEKWMITEDEVTAVRPSPENLGRAKRIDDAMGRYLTNLKTIFGRDFELKDKKIVFDAANGAAYDCGVRLFEELGANVVPLNCQPNGKNINVNCALTNPKTLSDAVIQHQADIGIAVDGDADRLYVFDETGELISGEHILYALAIFLRESKRLNQDEARRDAVVTTTMANQALELAFQKEGIELYRTQVGDRYVTELMQEKNLILGGENSGHYLFLDQNTTGDGLFSALEVLALLHKRKWKASALKKSFVLFPQKLLSIKVKDRVPFEQIPKLHQAILELEKQYEGLGRVNVRYSGTESVLRVMVEGPDSKRVERDVNAFVKLAKEELGGHA